MQARALDAFSPGAAAAEPDFALGHFNMANVLEAMERGPEAISEYETGTPPAAQFD